MIILWHSGGAPGDNPTCQNKIQFVESKSKHYLWVDAGLDKTCCSYSASKQTFFFFPADGYKQGHQITDQIKIDVILIVIEIFSIKLCEYFCQL